jgi:hypothetical protein
VFFFLNFVLEDEVLLILVVTGDQHLLLGLNPLRHQLLDMHLQCGNEEILLGTFFLCSFESLKLLVILLKKLLFMFISFINHFLEFSFFLFSFCFLIF